MFGLELSFIWAGLIALSVLIYVMLDGFDLGVGILFPLARDEDERGQMMNSIAPVWDGNETWLVLGGGGLFAVFPLAYAVVMPALYMPIILMLLALIFRGVAFEYRWQTRRWKRVWDHAFFGGSLVAATMQGIALGALVQGITVADRAYAGGWWDWLTPFSILTGVAVPVGYALLGATWMNLVLEGRLQAHMRKVALRLAVATLLFLGLVSLFTPLQNPDYAARWFTFPAAIYSAVVPILVLLAAWRLWARPEARAGSEPVPLGAGAFYPRVCRDRHQLLSDDRAAGPDHRRSRRAGYEPEVHPRRHALPAADHPCLYRLCLLGLPRQDQGGRGVSLGCGCAAQAGSSCSGWPGFWRSAR